MHAASGSSEHGHLGYAGEQILDVRADGLNGGKLLLLAKPLVDGDGVGILVVLDVDVHVFERLGEGTAISSHDNDPGFDTDGDCSTQDQYRSEQRADRATREVAVNGELNRTEWRAEQNGERLATLDMEKAAQAESAAQESW